MKRVTVAEAEEPTTSGGPDALLAYKSKRNFEKTAEPRGRVEQATGDRFCVQKHHATRAKANGIRKTLIIFHYPVFARSGLGPIPAPDNPHKVIASYAKDMEVVLLNGHVHTTEIYEVDGVKYLMLGGGGAEQDPILPGRTSIKVPADYPPDLYWKGKPPMEEYNYVLVDVEAGQKTKFTLNRFRPWSAEPFGTEELFR